MAILGAYYRRVAANKRADIAVFATARKLAILIYRILRWEQPYVDDGAAAHENRYRATRVRSSPAAKILLDCTRRLVYY